MFTRVLTLAITCLATAANAQTFLVNETFDDLDRLNQNAPSSLRWTVGAHHDSGASAFGSLDASSGKLVLDHTLDSSGSYATALGYFTESGSPFTLGIGETLRLSFEVTFTNGTLPNSSNGFRWALFDSGGVRVTNDFAGTNESGVSQGSTFSGWRGYEALLPVAGTPTTAGDFLTRERNGSGNGLFTSANWNEVGTSSVAEPLFSTGTAYSGFLELTRSSSGVTLQAGINGVVTRSVLDTSPRLTFDTIGFFVLNTVPTDVVLDNIQLSVVPEPSSALAMLAGAAVLGCTRRRVTLKISSRSKEPV